MGLSQLFPNALGPCFLCPMTFCVGMALVVPRLKPSKALGIVGEACLLLGLRFADVCQRWLNMKLLLCPRLRPDSAMVQGLHGTGSPLLDSSGLAWIHSLPRFHQP